MRDLPPRARVYVLAVVGAAVATLLSSALAYSGRPGQLLTFAALFAATSAYSKNTAQNVAFNVSFIVGLAAVAVLGPEGACLVGAAGLVAGARGLHLPLVKRLFNSAMFALSGLASGAVYVLAGGPVGELNRGHFPDVLVAAALGAIVYYFVNISLVSGVVSLTRNMPLLRLWFASLSPTAITYLGYGLLGLVTAGMYYEMGTLAAVLVLAPLLVARAAFANYVELRGAYDSTVRALVQAVETKDYYTRGHSERVGRLTELIAREWGMREDRVEVIRIAGMLHDVGKIGVPTRVLQKQGKLNDDEFEAIKTHPSRGQEMLGDIEFLREALSGVYHHHERMDGRGYPMGLVDQEIPEFARIIMVADAFDSMTSTRSYRLAKSVEDAVAELRRCQGFQFDPLVVDCLVRAIGKHGWEPLPEDFHGEKVTKDGRFIDSPVPVVSTRTGLVPVVPAEDRDAAQG